MSIQNKDWYSHYIIQKANHKQAKACQFRKFMLYFTFQQQEFSEKGDSVQLHKEDLIYGEKMEEQRQ